MDSDLKIVAKINDRIQMGIFFDFFDGSKQEIMKESRFFHDFLN